MDMGCADWGRGVGDGGGCLGVAEQGQPGAVEWGVEQQGLRGAVGQPMGELLCSSDGIVRTEVGRSTPCPTRAAHGLRGERVVEFTPPAAMWRSRSRGHRALVGGCVVMWSRRAYEVGSVMFVLCAFSFVNVSGGC